MRKTARIETLIKEVNDYLLNSADNEIASREAQIKRLETALAKSGKYNGFEYLTEADMRKSANGTTPGIGKQKKDGTWDLSNSDRTRVRYYAPAKTVEG